MLSQKREKPKSLSSALESSLFSVLLFKYWLIGIDVTIYQSFEKILRFSSY